MLQNNEPTETRSYLVIVEQQLDVDSERVENQMASGLMFMEGIGTVDVVPMGLYEEESVPTSPVMGFDTLPESGL